MEYASSWLRDTLCHAQHPNMFAAVIADGAVTDLLRYPLFTIGAQSSLISLEVRIGNGLCL